MLTLYRAGDRRATPDVVVWRPGGGIPPYRPVRGASQATCQPDQDDQRLSSLPPGRRGIHVAAGLA